MNQILQRSAFGMQMESTPKGQWVQVSNELFYKMFHQEVDPLKDALLVENGNRPIETTEQVIDIFCRSIGCKYYFDVIAREHFFIA
jgi:hypothetical protein